MPMAKLRLFLIAALVLAVSPALDCARSTATGPAGQQRKTSEPYTGDLSIFETPGRDEKLQINRVMDILGIAAGKSVADIGAGSGWFSVRAAKRVGNGIVYAVDINPEAVRYITERAKKEQMQNIKAILSKPEDPLLPPNSVDAVLLLKTYHEVAQPNRNGNGEDHGIQRDVVIREAQEAGYKLLDQYDFVKGDNVDYFLVFTAAP